MIDKTVIFVKIKGIGFTFLLDKKVKCNLISPVLMSFFNIEEKQQYSFPIDNLIEVNSSVLGNYEYQRVSTLEEVIGDDEILSYQDKYLSW